MTDYEFIGNGAGAEGVNLSKALAVATVEEQCMLAEEQAALISAAKLNTETDAEIAYDV